MCRPNANVSRAVQPLRDTPDAFPGARGVGIVAVLLDDVDRMAGPGFARTEGNGMAVRQVTDVLLVWLLAQAPIESGAGRTEIPLFLREPGYFIEKQGDKWALKKPGPAGSRVPAGPTITGLDHHRRQSARGGGKTDEDAAAPAAQPCAG